MFAHDSHGIQVDMNALSYKASNVAALRSAKRLAAVPVDSMPAWRFVDRLRSNSKHDHKSLQKRAPVCGSLNPALLSMFAGVSATVVHKLVLLLKADPLESVVENVTVPEVVKAPVHVIPLLFLTRAAWGYICSPKLPRSP